MNLSTDLAPLMRELRQQLNLSQRRFAAHLKVSVRTVNRWENGHTLPSSLALRALEEKLRDETFLRHTNLANSAGVGEVRAIADTLRASVTQARSPLNSNPDK
ncbi:MAG: helix-turn-helix transcriptional regulator [Synechococcales bacterium]|nr:helix-turn-helix transcriptional regulator [Synechococcales bacterium]